MYQKKFMEAAIAEAREGINNGDGGPFGAVVVKDGEVVASGHNRVLKNNDSTCHGEGRVDVVARLCMVVDWCLEHPEYTAKLRVIPKKDYPLVLSCIF